MLRCDLIEIVGVGNGKIMIFDEDGKGKELPLNREATKIAGPYLFPGDCIVGHALVCDSDDLK
jgi:hypothetical protein